MNFKKEELLKDQDNSNYMMLLPTLNDIYDEFSYLDLTKEEFLETVMKSLDDKNVSLKSTDFTNEIYAIVKEKFSTIALSNKESREKLLQIITKYIDSLQSSNDYETLNKIAQFIDKKTSEVDIDFLLELINKNKKLNELLKQYATKRFDILENNMLNNLCEAYCAINNIKTEIEDYQDLCLTRDNARAYLNEIRGIKILTEKEEYECVVAMKKGNEKSRNTLVESNLRLAVSVAMKYRNYGIPLLDLIQEGNIALMKAADMFDLSKNCKFSTYATFWIRQYIQRYIGNKARTIRLPIHINETIMQLNKAEKELKDELKRSPKLEEIAEKTGIPLSKVRYIYDVSKSIFSLNNEIEPEDEASENIMKFIADEKSEAFVDKIINAKFVEELLANSHLSPKELEIIKMRYGIGGQKTITYQEIANKFGVSITRIQQNEETALRKLRQAAINSEKIVKKISKHEKAPNKKVEFKPIVLFGIQQTIYETFPDYTIEEVNEAVRRLGIDDREIVRIRFGDDLSRSVSKIVWPNKKIKDKYFHDIIIKIEISLLSIRKRNENRKTSALTRNRMNPDK